MFNNQRVGQVITGFEPQKKKGFFFQAYPTEVGVLQSKIVLPSDDYELDNIWYDTMPIMEKINCQIIGSDSSNINLLGMEVCHFFLHLSQTTNKKPYFYSILFKLQVFPFLFKNS